MFEFSHENHNVFDLEKSIQFFEEALGLEVKREVEAADKSWKIVYMGNEQQNFKLELTWNRDREKPYDLGENETHLAFETDDFAAAYEKHKKMGCICYENHDIGIYFINDPDGYWLEIIPKK